MESEWELQMETTTDHLTLAQMLQITQQTEEVIERYDLNLKPLNYNTLESWELFLRQFVKKNTKIDKIRELVNQYKSHITNTRWSYVTS